MTLSRNKSLCWARVLFVASSFYFIAPTEAADQEKAHLFLRQYNCAEVALEVIAHATGASIPDSARYLVRGEGIGDVVKLSDLIEALRQCGLSPSPLRSKNTDALKRSQGAFIVHLRLEGSRDHYSVGRFENNEIILYDPLFSDEGVSRLSLDHFRTIWTGVFVTFDE